MPPARCWPRSWPDWRIGSALSGRVIRRGISPLAAFGAAEILIGVTGLLSPILLDAASAIYVALSGIAPDSFGVLTIARLVCSFAILALPTTMMGITLPLLTAAVSRQADSAGTSVSWLYALNTLGAMTGTLLAGYILIPAIGIRAAFVLAAALNVIVGSIALWLARGPAKAGPHKESAIEQPPFYLWSPASAGPHGSDSSYRWSSPYPASPRSPSRSCGSA